MSRDEVPSTKSTIPLYLRLSLRLSLPVKALSAIVKRDDLSQLLNKNIAPKSKLPSLHFTVEILVTRLSGLFT